MQRLVGVLAGMGPRSTAPFVDMLVTEFQQQCGAKHDDDFPPIMILSWPTPFGVNRPIDHDALRAAIQAGLAKLESTGVDVIAMPCNTAHLYFETLAAGIGVPLLNMIAETACAIPSATNRLALLATRPTVTSRLYQTEVKGTGREVVLDPGWQDLVDDAIRAVKAGHHEDARKLWSDLLFQVGTAGVDAALVACTDLSPLVALDVPGSPPLIDAGRCLAAATVRWWKESSGC